MDGVTSNHQFVLIKICQLSKWTGNPIFNENNQYPKDLILASEKMKIIGTIILKKNSKQFLHIKVK